MDWMNGSSSWNFEQKYSGWRYVLFKGWFENHFLKHARQLLLMNGHSSQYNLKAIHLTKTNDVLVHLTFTHNS